MTRTLDGLPDILWHGTTLHHARTIAATGMLGTGASGCPSKVHVCLTAHRATATFFAMCKAECHPRESDEGRPVLLAIPRSALDPKRLRSDTLLVAAPFRAPSRFALDSVDAIQAYLDREARRSTRDWRHSLDAAGGIIHGGAIPLDCVQCDDSIIDAPFWETDGEKITTEHTGVFPRGWSVPRPRLHTLSPSDWDPSQQLPVTLSDAHGAKDEARTYIHTTLGQMLGLTPHSIDCACAFPAYQLHYTVDTPLPPLAHLHATFHAATTRPGAPLLMLPAQGREPGRRAIVPTLLGINTPKKRKPTLAFHIRTQLLWIHPDRVPQHPGLAAATCAERAAA